MMLRDLQLGVLPCEARLHNPLSDYGFTLATRTGCLRRTFSTLLLRLRLI